MTDTVRPFTEFLTDLSNGRTHDELSEGLAEMVARVKETGKKGSLTLTIAVEPLKNAGGALKVSDSVVVKSPAHDRRVDVFYANDLGSLSKNDPQQPELEGLKDAPEKVEEPLREGPAIAEPITLRKKEQRA